MLDQPIVLTTGALVTFVSAIGIGYKAREWFDKRRNGKPRNGDMPVLQKDCNIRYGRLEKHTKFMKYLLMETTTPEQQDSAKQKADMFDE